MASSHMEPRSVLHMVCLTVAHTGLLVTCLVCPAMPLQVRGGAKKLVIDLGVVLEGQHAWELPEVLLGAVRWDTAMFDG